MTSTSVKWDMSCNNTSLSQLVTLVRTFGEANCIEINLWKIWFCHYRGRKRGISELHRKLYLRQTKLSFSVSILFLEGHYKLFYSDRFFYTDKFKELENFWSLIFRRFILHYIHKLYISYWNFTYCSIYLWAVIGCLYNLPIMRWEIKRIYH